MNHALEILEEKKFFLENKKQDIINNLPELLHIIEKKIKDLDFAIELIRLNIKYNN